MRDILKYCQKNGYYFRLDYAGYRRIIITIIDPNLSREDNEHIIFMVETSIEGLYVALRKLKESINIRKITGANSENIKNIS